MGDVWQISPGVSMWHLLSFIGISPWLSRSQPYASECSFLLATSSPVPCSSIFYFSPWSRHYWCPAHILPTLSIPVHANGFLLQAPRILCLKIFLAAGACSVMSEAGWECQSIKAPEQPSTNEKRELSDIPAPPHLWGIIWRHVLPGAPHQGWAAVTTGIIYSLMHLY